MNPLLTLALAIGLVVALCTALVSCGGSYTVEGSLSAQDPETGNRAEIIIRAVK